jgi:hypothetical protein
MTGAGAAFGAIGTVADHLGVELGRKAVAMQPGDVAENCADIPDLAYRAGRV